MSSERRDIQRHHRGQPLSVHKLSHLLVLCPRRLYLLFLSAHMHARTIPCRAAANSFRGCAVITFAQPPSSSLQERNDNADAVKKRGREGMDTVTMTVQTQTAAASFEYICATPIQVKP
jgi:hypothetical protein